MLHGMGTIARTACTLRTRAGDRRRALSSSSTLRSLCWTCCLHSKTADSGGGAAGAGEHPHGQCLPGPRPPAWQPARTGHHHAARGTAHILAGVGVGVRKRSGLTGAPAVNVLSGFSARCMSAALSWNHTRNQAPQPTA